VTVPLERWLYGDWRYALAFWAGPALLAVLAWAPQVRGKRPISQQQTGSVPRLRSNWLAWQVTLFMGMQGAIAYCIFGWLPLILTDRGLSSEESGYVLASLMLIQLTPSLAGPWIATRGKDQRP